MHDIGGRVGIGANVVVLVLGHRCCGGLPSAQTCRVLIIIKVNLTHMYMVAGFQQEVVFGCQSISNLFRGATLLYSSRWLRAQVWRKVKLIIN